MIYVGIDTGVNTGFAVWDSKQRSLLQVCSLPIHKAMERVRSLYNEYKAGLQMIYSYPLFMQEFL